MVVVVVVAVVVRRGVVVDGGVGGKNAGESLGEGNVKGVVGGAVRVVIVALIGRLIQLWFGDDGGNIDYCGEVKLRDEMGWRFYGVDQRSTKIWSKKDIASAYEWRCKKLFQILVRKVKR